MCGIFALFLKTREIKFVKIQEAFNTLKNRGPDFSTLEKINSNYFGFHRLAINDLSANGNQPFIDGDLVLICNGEIYNSEELKNTFFLENVVKSKSDCEIILHLYRLLGIENTIKLLDGVFAFVLFDKLNQTMHVGRDRIGVRPVFYHIDNDLNLCVASESKALNFLGFNNVHQLHPGHYMTVNSNTYGFTIYYNPPSFPNPEIDDKNISKNIRNYLTESVLKRLMSDREIGCLLSGGVDSSIIASILSNFCKENGKKISTFSIGFQDSEDLKYARKVAEFIDSDHHEVVISYEEALEVIPEVIYHIESYDITTIRASVGMYLISKYISENFKEKVIFSGEGADEVLCGYLYFHYAPSETELFNESRHLVKNLPYFDVLRADRTTAAHGLELRVPFLDRNFIDYCLEIPGQYRKPQEHIDKNGDKINIEKYYLRKAFTGELPDEVLWRRKEGFSDGVGGIKKPWYVHIEEFVNTKITNTDFDILKFCFEKKFPSKEAWYYYKNYINFFPINE